MYRGRDDDLFVYSCVSGAASVPSVGFNFFFFSVEASTKKLKSLEHHSTSQN